jgi:hypothetical protein
MSTWVKVARFNLERPTIYLMLPCILPFSFAVGAVTTGRLAGHDATHYLPVFFVYFTLLGMQAIGRSLAFCLALGVSRRSFYSGTVLLGIALALVSGLVLTGLQALERVTGGWGLSMHFLRVPYLLDGPWYATWLTSAVCLFALFVYGTWYGIVHLRWGPLGTLAFVVAQVLVVAGVSIAVSAEHGHVWSRAGGSFAGLTALGLTGAVAALTILLLAGGDAAIGRTAV